MCVCLYVSMLVCVCMCLLCVHVCVCMCLCMCVCMFVLVSVSASIRGFVYVCVYASLYVTYKCMIVYGVVFQNINPECACSARTKRCVDHIQLIC